MKKASLTNLQLIFGLLLTSIGLYLNKYDQLPDFFKGLIYGIGMGLMILFVIKKSRERNPTV